ncbi:ATP phosphoribosyltransferase [Desulfobacterota bacterium AH_259_B03_O07]|nr:ATP phosphoribosyltransferase [Desulfobacterota bacterium AH_259_B03_O07]
MITLAIARGRLLKEAAGVLRKTGLTVGEIYKDSRKLIFEFPKIGLKILIVRPFDVPSYVEYGAADCGIVGRDTLIEEKHELYEPLDLGIGKCKLIVAAPKGFEFSNSRLIRVATKYPKISYEHFVKKGLTTEIVKLYGSVELAPIVGLSDVIVDLSATGETLRKNKLVEIETIANITARLVVNKVSMKVKSAEIKDFLSKLKKYRKF